MRRLCLPLILAAVLAADVTEEKLKSAQGDQSSWLSYGRNYSGWRHSGLSQITAGNVARLTPKWMFQTGVFGKFETTPLVFDGMMFVTGPENHAWALDLVTGRPIWHYSKPVPAAAGACCGKVNRGFAALGDRLFKVNLEATLVALDSKTGNVIWETPIGDIKRGYTTTVAPLVAKNLVIVGIAGAEFGVRGFIDAYDATTGKRAWRFWTVADPQDPVGGKTWAGDTWTRGGGSTWVTGTYDPELNLTYWGTGNPGPGMYGDERKGDNLYTNCIVALDVTTGKLKWFYQMTPHDTHDWDAISDPVLLDLTVKGQRVKAVVQANRNGFYYALDRVTGKLLAWKAYTKVSWADGIGDDGRPKEIAGHEPTETGNKACPGIGGGHNWQASTYSPQTGMYYFGAGEGCQIFFKTKQDYTDGMRFEGSTAQTIPQEPVTGAVLGIDPATGATRWRFPTTSSPSGGLLSTAGGLVFAGDRDGYVFALDAGSGNLLWQFQTGGAILAPPITYLFQGKQYVTISGGSALITFAIP